MWHIVVTDTSAYSRVRGKELEENGFGVVLDKKRARPFRTPPWWLGLVVSVFEQVGLDPVGALFR